ncbi:MAG: hypothetical protein IT298_08100 [Chloroflexi bacterium]|nr:hypothetical protein [Chloroflexota bacterium]MEB2365736.1 hypothetical protein [Chloroflexota bacterium]
MVKPLAERLLIKAGQHVCVLNAPVGLLASLDGLPDTAAVSIEAAESADVWLVFVNDAAAVAEHGPVIAGRAKPGAVVWFAYPKKSGAIKTDISRDSGWGPVESLGWAPVTQISVNETWSALRFKPVGDIKTITRKFGPHAAG